MKKNRKKIFIVIILFVIAVAAVFGVMINRGFRFTSESALTSSSEEYRIIQTKEYNFYYTAIDFTDRVAAVFNYYFIYGIGRVLLIQEGIFFNRNYAFYGFKVVSLPVGKINGSIIKIIFFSMNYPVFF